MFYNEWQKEVSPLVPLLLIDSVIALMANAAALAMAVAIADNQSIIHTLNSTKRDR